MTHRLSSRRSITVFLVIALVLGFLVRILAGYPVVRTDLVYSPGIRQKPPGTKSPGDVVVSFYMFLDSGLYEKAWELVLEPDFIGTGKVVNFSEEIEANPDGFYGWTDRERFVERMRRELGQEGTGITLKNIQVDAVQPVDFRQYAMKHPLLNNLQKSFSPGLQDGVGGAFLVDVTGNLLGACTIFKWDKRIMVLRIDKRYRILLSGTKSAKSFFYQGWFSNIEKIGNLRGVQ
jgi:hypothetical protein